MLNTPNSFHFNNRNFLNVSTVTYTTPITVGDWLNVSTATYTTPITVDDWFIRTTPSIVNEIEVLFANCEFEYPEANDDEEECDTKELDKFLKELQETGRSYGDT